MRRSVIYKLLTITLAGCASIGVYSPARAEDNKEYLVKAAFIYNFVKFVEWPGEKAISQHPKIDICMLGNTPLSQASKVFTAASTPKLALSLVQESSAAGVIKHCHVVFISQSESDHLSSILSELKGKPVLTVSDIDGFAHAGGMMGFVLNDNKIKVAVNKKAVVNSELRVDAQLLEIAQEVIDK